MNKKILLGSIIAVVILVGVLFTSVVGFQSVKSNVKASPLFTIRTKRAIDEESKDFTCDYVGKGEGAIVPFPTRIGTTPIQKFMEKIRAMDDKAFNKFIFFAIVMYGV